MRHHANVIEAAAARGVEHLVFLSIMDIDESSPFYFAPVYRDAERRLAEHGLASTTLRCGLYADLVLTDLGRAREIDRECFRLPAGQGRVAPVSRDDVAAAAAKAIVSPHHRGKVYELTGPKSYSFDEIAGLASRLSGAPIQYVPCSADDYQHRARMEMQDPWPHAFATLCASISQGRYERVSSHLENLLGRPAEALDDFFRRTLHAAGRYPTPT